MNYQKIQVKQLSGAGGAEITGVDLASADDQTIAEIESALHEFLVVTLPDQPASPRDWGLSAWSLLSREIPPIPTWLRWSKRPTKSNA